MPPSYALTPIRSAPCAQMHAGTSAQNRTRALACMRAVPCRMIRGTQRRHLQTLPQLPGACRPREAASRYTGRGIRVAMLDTGLDLQHPDFREGPIISRSFVPGQTESMIPTVTARIVREYCAGRRTLLRDPATVSPPMPICISPRCWTIRPTVPTATFSQASTGRSGTVARSSPCHSVRPCSRALPTLRSTNRSPGVRSPPALC